MVVCKASPCGDVKMEPKGVRRLSGHVLLCHTVTLCHMG